MHPQQLLPTLGHAAVDVPDEPVEGVRAAAPSAKPATTSAIPVGHT